MGWGASSAGRGQTGPWASIGPHRRGGRPEPCPGRAAAVTPPQAPGCRNLLHLPHQYDLGVNICASGGVRTCQDGAVLRSPSARCQPQGGPTQRPSVHRDASAHRAGQNVCVCSCGNSSLQRSMCVAGCHRGRFPGGILSTVSGLSSMSIEGS